MCVLSAAKFLPKGLFLFALICLYFHLVPWDCSSLTLKSMLGLQVSLDVALLIQGVLMTQEVELGFFFFFSGDFLNAYLLFLFVSVCPFCFWTCAFVQEVLLSVDWINFCPVGFEYVLQFLGFFFEVQMFHMLTQSDLVIFNRGILSLGTPDGWAGKRSLAPGGVSQCPHLFQRGAVGTDPP